jgi:hypothetical protein
MKNRKQTDHYNALLEKLKPCPENWRELSKAELAEARLPEGTTYDVALPQIWLDKLCGDNHEKYKQIVERCVWVYPQGSIFGLCLNLSSGRYIL